MPTDPSTSPWLRHALVALLLLAILVLTFSVLQPFLVPLIWGGILAYVSWPLHLRCMRLFRGRTTLAALCTTLMVTLLIIVPVVWLLWVLRVEAEGAYANVQAFLASKPKLPDVLLD